ncbi:RNA polymerase sigma factor [Altererythrobacter sp. H2]|uniref:RNA polymerase sigma factor n=1 Tax=Altererythrobacter sp. H2 TaxID=3108391 RepID=UPI002B4C06B6|nr:RNA polymerase sigma factor [Altererythrobacter sp. H2]WRK96717.1 RNA polymerase sigma factor [Altererythrobacter sp. H2]
MTQQTVSLPPAALPGADAHFDGLLVTLLLSGDRRAGSRLYARWHPRLLRTARRHTGSSELAASAVQDCWLAIWRGLPGLRDPGHFAPWAFGILRRRCADQVTALARERSRCSETGGQSAEAAPDDRIAIIQAFATLSPVHRLAAHLFFVEGLSLAEIALVQEVPEGTVKSRLFHARRQLKAALSGDNQ